MKQDIFIFGASKGGENYLEILKAKCSLYNVIGFIDNDSSKAGSQLNGVNVYTPEKLYEYNKNVKIIIASSYFNEISKQLDDMGYTNYIIGNRQDKYVKGALYEFRESTKKLVYAKTLKVSTDWSDNASPQVIQENKDISKKVLNLYQKMCKEQIKNIYKPGFAWENSINKNIYDLYGAMKRNDIEKFTNLIYDFRQFGTVLGIADEDDALRFLDHSFSDKEFINSIVGAYEALIDNLDPKIINNIDESIVGNPLYIYYKGRRLTTEVLRHAYYLQRIKEFADNINFKNKKIFVELGGGTGDTARQMKKYFEEKIVYVILDLPEVLTISSYYLMRNFPNLNIGTYDDFYTKSYISYHDLVNYDIVLLPNHFIERLEDDIVAVFINTASLGEMERDIANNYLKQIGNKCDYLFYSNNRKEQQFQIDGEYRKVGVNNIVLGKNWNKSSEIGNINIYKAIKNTYIEEVFIKSRG